MSPEEYGQLRQTTSGGPAVILGSMLKNQQSRTLIWGYTSDRMNFHVYLLQGCIFINEEGQPLFDETEVTDNRCYAPSKRAYPECCDYEFCQLLKQVGVSIPFTTPSPNRPVPPPPSGFYGPLG